MSYIPLKTVAGFAVTTLLLGGAALAGCQSYELDPVSPKAIAAVNKPVPIDGKRLPPNIMLVVDRSGSMSDSASGTGAACTVTGVSGDVYSPLSTNSCKWNDLKSAVADPKTGFLAQAKDVANFGLMVFPEPKAVAEGCEPGVVVFGVGPSQTAQIADQINSKIFPEGGTPTGPSLKAAGKHPSMTTKVPGQDRFIILMTDGLPNCNPRNAGVCNSCAGKTNCGSSCIATFPGPCDTPFSGANCLDEGGIVEEVTALKNNGIQTFVIGFGKDTASGDANRVLNKAAEAGGRARSDPNAATKYFQANNVADLKEALKKITDDFQTCDFNLDPAPSSAAVVQVTIHDNTLSGDAADRLLVHTTDWEISSSDPGKLTIKNPACTEIQGAAPGKLEIRFSYAAEL